VSGRSAFLAVRREALRAHCAVQRIQLADQARQLETRLANVDRAISIVRRIARRPVLIAGGIALLALVGPRRIVRLASRGAVLLTTGSRVLRLMRNRSG